MDTRSASWKPQMRCCSSAPGRERWQVDALFGNPSLASALEEELRRRAGVRRVGANPWMGRITVGYTPGATEASVEQLLREALARLEARGEAGAGPRDELEALLRVLGGTVDGGRRLTGPLLVSLASHAVHILQGLSFVATVSAARESVPGKGKKAFALRAMSRLGRLSAMTLGLSTADLYLRHQRRKTWQRLARDIERELRERVFAAILEQEMGVLDKQGPGRLMNAVTTDVAHLGALIERGFDDGLYNALLALVSAALLLVGSPGLALTAAAPLSLIVLPARRLGKKTAEASARMSEASDLFSGLLENSLSGIGDIKSYTAENEVLRRVVEYARELAESSKDAASAASLQGNLIEGVFSVGFSLMAAAGGAMVSRDRLAQGSYARALYSFPQLVVAMAGLQGAMGTYRSAGAAALRLVELLGTRPTIRGGSIRLPREEVKGEVVFEEVSFGYEPSRTVIDRASLRLEPGKTLGIVGPTGSGKSTLLRLLLRIYDVTAGRILIDGKDIRELDLKDLRDAVAVVGQEPYLFRGTVRENLRLGQKEASEEELLEALRKAAALEFVEVLPERLDADIGERGRRLSGGQRQRLAIARALLKKAPILVLDEATSQLDYETEAAIQRTIKDSASGTSMIIVAHRLSTIRQADRILVVDEGRIRESGRHDELLARGDLYAYLWRLQNGQAA